MAYGGKNKIRVQGEFDDKISSKLDKLRDKFDTLGKNKGAQSILMGVGLGAGTMALNALGSAASRVGELAFAAIDDASNLAETMSKGRVIFGESADEIEAWADTAATAFGQSKRQAIDTASGFAGLFDTVGLSLDDSKNMAKDLTVLGSDLASFFNTDVDSALQALKSGLSGESEPLRAFNVFLSETAVSAKLAEMGIKKTGGAFTEAQKATARYALIMEQTTTAQGDFANTSGGLANSQRIIAAQMEGLSAEVGEELLPVMLELMTFVKDTGVPVLHTLLDVTKELAPALGGLPLASVAEGMKDVADESLSATDRIIGLGDATVGALPIIGWFYDEATKAFREVAGGADDVALASDKLKGSLERDIPKANDAVGSLGDQAVDTRDEFWKAMDDIVEKTRTTKDDLVRSLNESVDAIYDPQRRHYQLIAIEFELAEQRKIRNDDESTEAQRNNARARIADLEAERLEIQNLQGIHGDFAGAAERASETMTAAWARATGSARAEIAEYIDQLAAARRATEAPIVARFSTIGQVGSGFTRRASGGPVSGGETYIVGEEGPELFVPQGSGSIVPNDQLASGGSAWSGTPVEIPIVLDGREIARVVDQHLYYRR